MRVALYFVEVACLVFGQVRQEQLPVGHGVSGLGMPGLELDHLRVGAGDPGELDGLDADESAQNCVEPRPLGKPSEVHAPVVQHGIGHQSDRTDADRTHPQPILRRVGVLLHPAHTDQRGKDAVHAGR